MELLIDLFGYLSVVVHGLTILAQSIALGSLFFLALLARPLAPRLGAPGVMIRGGCERIAAWSALGLAGAEAVTLALQTAVLVGTLDLPPGQILLAEYAVAGLIKVFAAGAIAALLFVRRARAPMAVLLPLAMMELAAATLTTHAMARLTDRGPLIVAEWLHQFGAALWIGGIPCFLFALSKAGECGAWRIVGSRFSRISMAGVACILLSGATMASYYIADWQGLYGTAYGVMTSAKLIMFLMLLALGGMNFLLIEGMLTGPGASVLRLRRFAEVELGIGLAIFFAAASLTSVPPAVDLPRDRLTWSEITARNTPDWPRLTSPDHDALALPALQAQLDAEAARQRTNSRAAFLPGAGEVPPRNAADIAWSEYNHHWAGLFVIAIGILAMAHQAGVRRPRHRPLVFLLMAGFLLVRSDPEVWPLGDVGFFESLRDVEVLQHRFFVLLIVAFALFEWRVRSRSEEGTRSALVFPLIWAAAATMLLTHSHAIANLKEQLLIELTHTPLALVGLLAGWSRSLEVRLDPIGDARMRRAAGWVWPAALVLFGLILLNYREA